MDDRLRELSKLGDKQAIIEGIRQSIRSSDLIGAKWHLFNAVLYFPKEIRLYTLGFSSEDLSVMYETSFFHTQRHVESTDHSFTDILLNEERLNFIQQGLYIQFHTFKINIEINPLDLLSLYSDTLYHLVDHRIFPRIGEHPFSHHNSHKQIWCPPLRIRDKINEKLSYADMEPSRKWYYYNLLTRSIREEERLYDPLNYAIRNINILFSFMTTQIRLDDNLRSHIEKLDSTLLYKRLLLKKDPSKEAIDWMLMLENLKKEITTYFREEIVKKEAESHE